MAKGVAVAVKLLIATTNADKRAEITAILDGLPLEIVTLGELPQLGDHEETGASFAENARDKARHYGAVTGLLTVAEDSGLEIDALDGTPGVQSARFNGATYPEKFRVVYEQLAARGAASSPARFVCALAVARGTDIIFEALGTVEGVIAPAPRGDAGFGYDPIFYYPPYGRTLAEVSRTEKVAVSHRGHAFRQLRTFLKTMLLRT